MVNSLTKMLMFGAYFCLSFISNVSAFYYKAIPVYAGPSKLSCPWKTYPKDTKCGIVQEGLGYYCQKYGANYGSINPVLQTCDFDASICRNHVEPSGNLPKCALNTTCHPISKTHRICTCGAGFFGDPYEKCYKHCETDEDCKSSFAECAATLGDNKLKTCKCKAGYDGDGTFCYVNPCGRGEGDGKCKSPSVCVPKGVDKFECVCPNGYYKDLDDGECKRDIVVEPGKVISFSGFGLKDGTRVVAGECLSFTLNDNNKSIFYNLNSGDSVFVKKRVVTTPEFYVAYEITDSNIVAYTLLEENKSELTKIYSVTNTTKNCKFGHLTILFPNGEYLLLDEHVKRTDFQVKVHVRQATETVAKEEL